jgi:two-component system chemotaxis sensor kinase CheA
VGELLQRQARLETIHQASPFWERHGEFTDELEGMARVVRELRERALDIRTTPVRRVLDRFPRVAAELAHSLGKKVQVELSGEEVELDRAVLDYLYDPLLHLVRNALDHGIEKPEERSGKGKPEAGTIRLSAAAASGRVRVRIEDDGAGIDVERVRARAVEQGLLVEAVAEDLPPERILEFIFEPGLTTRSSVTSVSGRGVGMDAVKRGIESLGGTMEVESRRGEGTAFEIDLPSVVALQRVVIVEAAGERVALPAVAVVAVLGLAEGKVEGVGPDAFFVWGDEPLPLVDLASRLGLETPPEGSRGAIVVVEMQAFRLGLRVDRVAAHLEVFVRKVPGLLGSIPLLGGGAILPDGVPVFLLEVGHLVEELS